MKHHIFKKTDDVNTGGAKFLEGAPIEACVCGVKRLSAEVMTTRQTLRTASIRKSTMRLYWKTPLDRRTGQGGWQEKNIPCTRG